MLSGRQRASLTALSDLLIPPGGAIPQSASEAGVPERIERWMTLFSPGQRRRFRMLIAAWDAGPLAARGFLKPFHRLDKGRQEEWVARMHHSPRMYRRLPLTLLKQMIFLAYASSPEFESHVGFDYTCRLEGLPHGKVEEPA